MRVADIPGVRLVTQAPVADSRGYFLRVFDAGAHFAAAQASVSHNLKAGTLRGLHYQREPMGETKLVRCLAGAIFDVAVDLRRDSPTFRRWLGVELAAGDGQALLIPPGVAHGFQTLADETTVLYVMDVAYAPGLAAGVRHDDPALAIAWPLPVTIISPRDAGLPRLES